MSNSRVALTLLGVALVSCFAEAARAKVSSSDLARCAGIDASDARLACYDALAGRGAAASGAVARTAPVAPTAPTAPAAASAPQAPAAPVAPNASDSTDNFGLAEMQQRQHVAPKGPSKIQAHVDQVVDAGNGRVVLVLDNGQSWAFTEAAQDARVSSGDPVTIKRASLGSFLAVLPSHRTVHVRRTQ